MRRRCQETNHLTSVLTFCSDHKFRASRSQVSGTEEWKSGRGPSTEPDMIQVICCSGPVGRADRRSRQSGLGLNHHRRGISLVSPDRGDLLTLLVYVHVARAALSSSEDTGDLTAPSFFKRSTSKKHANIQIFTKMHHKKLPETPTSSSNVTVELIFFIPFRFAQLL